MHNQTSVVELTSKFAVLTGIEWEQHKLLPRAGFFFDSSFQQQKSKRVATYQADLAMPMKLQNKCIYRVPYLEQVEIDPGLLNENKKLVSCANS